MTTDEELQRKIDALRKSFAAGLGARFTELETAVAALLPGQSLAAQSTPIKIILEQAHKIAGSAGTFGFGEMSAIASQTEQLCDRIVKNQHGSDEDALRDLQDKVAAIRAQAPQ
jgi:HPt (histidine-containing phosphotransfer) domain-containing protein